MISYKYKEAKKIAIKAIKEAGVLINKADELLGVYFFSDSEHEYIGMLPMAVRKSDGKLMNFIQYIMDSGDSYSDAKDIPFYK